MNINYPFLIVFIFMLFIINKNLDKNFTYEKNTNISDIDKAPVNKESTIKEKIKDAIIKINDLSPIKIKGLNEKEPIRVISNDYKQVVDETTFQEDKDYISPNPEGSTEFRFIDENPKTAWSTTNVSQHPKYYTSNFENEKMDLSGFFNKDKFYGDKTSPNSTSNLPDRCSVNSNNEVLCNYNNKLHLVPPKLISNNETNGVLNNIGQGKGDIFKTIDSTIVNNISGNNYQVWNYENEKSINGGEYFNGVFGSSMDNESYMNINDMKPDYSF